MSSFLLLSYTGPQTVLVQIWWCRLAVCWLFCVFCWLKNAHPASSFNWCLSVFHWIWSEINEYCVLVNSIKHIIKIWLVQEEKQNMGRIKSAVSVDRDDCSYNDLDAVSFSFSNSTYKMLFSLSVVHITAHLCFWINLAQLQVFQLVTVVTDQKGICRGAVCLSVKPVW